MLFFQEILLYPRMHTKTSGTAQIELMVGMVKCSMFIFLWEIKTVPTLIVLSMAYE